MATTPIDVFCPASGRPGVSPASSASTVPRRLLPSSARTPARIRPVAGSTTSPYALTATSAATTRPPAGGPTPCRRRPSWRRRGRTSCPRSRRRRRRRCPRPRARSRRRARPRGPPPRPGRIFQSPIARSNRIAAGTIGTFPTPTGKPIPFSSRYRITPVAASRPKADPPERRTAWTCCTRVHGIEQVGLARPGRPAAHVHPAHGPRLGHDHGASRRPPRVREVTHPQPRDVGQAPADTPSGGAPASPARAPEGQAIESPAARAAEKRRRSISLIPPMLAPAPGALSSRSLCLLSKPIHNMELNFAPCVGHSRTSPWRRGRGEGKGEVMRFKSALLAVAAVSALVPAGPHAEGIKGRWSVALQGGTDIELSGNVHEGGSGTVLALPTKVEASSYGDVYDPSFRGQIGDRLRRRPQERSLPARLLLQDGLRAPCRSARSPASS